MTSSPTPDPSNFATRAATYDELRPLDRRALNLIEEVVRDAGLAERRVPLPGWLIAIAYVEHA
jgi:hypothetical protein